MPTFLRGCADKTRTLIELQYRRGDGSICGRNANQPSKSNQVTKDQSPEQLVAQPRRRGVVRVEMNQKIQSKVGKAPRYRRKMRRMHWQPSTQRQANEGLILTKRGNAVAYWPAGWYSISRYMCIDAVTSNRPRAEERARPPACHETQNLQICTFGLFLGGGNNKIWTSSGSLPTETNFLLCSFSNFSPFLQRLSDT